MAEEVYVMQCQPGWGEHFPTILDDLPEVTPTAIVKGLRKQFPTEHKHIKPIEINKWLKQMRAYEGDENDRPSLPLFAEEECDKCGHDPEIRYELEYQKKGE